MSNISLPLNEFSNLQVVARPDYGSFSLSLEPLENYKISAPNSPSLSASSEGDHPSIHFEVSHDDLGPVLRIFISQDCVLPCQSLRLSNGSHAVMADHGLGDEFTFPRDSGVSTTCNGKNIMSRARQNESTMHHGLSSSAEPIINGNIFPWARNVTPRIPHSFANQNLRNNNYSQMVHGDGLHIWTTQSVLDGLGSGQDLISASVLDVSFPIHPSPTAATSSPPLGSETSSPLATEYSGPNSSPSPHDDPTRYEFDLDHVVESAFEPPAPSVSSEGEDVSEKPFICRALGCSRRFKSQHTLKSHAETHRSKRPTSFPCTLGCSERFTRQHDRLRHEVAKHARVCEWSCQQCRRFFSSQRTLSHHRCPMTAESTRWVN